MSFKLKTVVGIASIEIVFLAVLVLSGLYYIRESNEERFVQQAHTTASLLATMTTDATVAMDLATLDELVRQTLENPNIMLIRIRAEDGTVLSAAGEDTQLDKQFVEDKDIGNAISMHQVDVVSPITIDDYVFGQVEISMSTDEIRTTVAEARDWMLGIAGTEIVLVALFGLLLGQVLTGQLNKLRLAAKRVADGELGTTIEVKGSDELAQTAASFNKMSESLTNYNQRLKHALDRAEEKRALAESRLLTAIDAMPQGVAIIEPNGDVLHLNENYKNLYNISTDFDANNAPFSTIAAMQAGAIVAQPFIKDRKTEETPMTQTIVHRMRLLADPDSNPNWECKLRNDKIIFCTQRKIPGGGMVLVDSDVTGLHAAADRSAQLERELLQKQRLESLGVLAGGVAHEINTPVQFIGDNLKFSQQSMDDLFSCIDELCDLSGKPEETSKILDDHDIEFLKEECPAAIQQGLEGVTRIRDIVSAVKIYTHPSTKSLAETDINRVVHNAAIVTANNWKMVASLNENLGEDLPTVQANEGQLSQVLVNLIVNAADALGEQIRDAEGSGTDQKIEISTFVKDKDNIVVKVSDTGPGIPRAIQKSVFDPFFTTKEVGRGTGQGLAICRSIICDQHSGRLELESEPGKGTVFYITLPIHQVSNSECAA